MPPEHPLEPTRRRRRKTHHLTTPRRVAGIAQKSIEFNSFLVLLVVVGCCRQTMQRPPAGAILANISSLERCSTRPRRNRSARPCSRARRARSPSSPNGALRLCPSRRSRARSWFNYLVFSERGLWVIPSGARSRFRAPLRVQLCPSRAGPVHGLGPLPCILWPG